MSGERINNTLRNNGIAGGVFSFSLNDLLSGGSGAPQTDGGRTPGAGSIQFTSLGDTIASAIQGGTGAGGQQGGGQGPDIAAIINNIVQSLNTAVTDPHASHRRATQRALDALTPLRLDEIPAEARASNCPICYEPYVEYAGDVAAGASAAAPEEDARETPATPATPQRSAADEVLDGPWKGYDLSDPSISFPAIETATYQHTYSLAAEPDLGFEAELPAADAAAQTPAAVAAADDDVHFAVRLPQCNHIFGRPCIVEWLQSNVSCPLCRREIVPELTEDTRTATTGLQQPGASGGMASERTYVYDTAITETYVPVDWTAPLSAGYVLSDPPLTLPVPGVGMSSGRRTGRDP